MLPWVPLQGMHNRIASEKDAVLDELTARVEDALSELEAAEPIRNGLPGSRTSTTSSPA